MAMEIMVGVVILGPLALSAAALRWASPAWLEVLAAYAHYPGRPL